MQKLPNSHLEGYPRGAVDRDRIRSIAAGPAPAYDACAAPFRTPIPFHSGHRFRSNPDSDSV